MSYLHNFVLDVMHLLDITFYITGKNISLHAE